MLFQLGQRRLEFRISDVFAILGMSELGNRFGLGDHPIVGSPTKAG